MEDKLRQYSWNVLVQNDENIQKTTTNLQLFSKAYK